MLNIGAATSLRVLWNQEVFYAAKILGNQGLYSRTHTA